MVGPLLGCTGHIYYVHAALGAPCSDLDGAHREGRRKAEGAQRLHCICLGNAHTPTCFVRGIRKHPQVLNYIFFRRAGGSGGAERERERERQSCPVTTGVTRPGWRGKLRIYWRLRCLTWMGESLDLSRIRMEQEDERSGPDSCVRVVEKSTETHTRGAG